MTAALLFLLFLVPYVLAFTNDSTCPFVTPEDALADYQAQCWRMLGRACAIPEGPTPTQWPDNYRLRVPEPWPPQEPEYWDFVLNTPMAEHAVDTSFLECLYEAMDLGSPGYWEPYSMCKHLLREEKEEENTEQV